MLTETRSRMFAIFAGLPPYSGIMLSTSRTSAPNATRRRAMAEPMRPSPPVITARVPAYPSSRGSDRNVTPPRPLGRHSQDSGDSYSHLWFFTIHGAKEVVRVPGETEGLDEIRTEEPSAATNDSLRPPLRRITRVPLMYRGSQN